MGAKVTQRESEVINHGEEIKVDINVTVQGLMERLKVSEREMVDKVNVIVEKTLKLLAQQKKEAEIALEQLQSCTEYVEQFLQHGSRQQVLQRKVKMVGRMKQMKQIDSSAFEQVDFVFLKKVALFEQCGNIGIVSCGQYSLSSHIPSSPMVGKEMMATVFFDNSSLNKQPFLVDALPPPTCCVTSMKNSCTTVCEAVRDENSNKIAISFIPSVDGDHQLQITSELSTIADYCVPFHVLSSPITRTGPVKTIKCLNKPVGVAVGENGQIAVIENKVQLLTLIDTEEKRVYLGSKLNNPRGVAFSSDGHVLVTDDHRLQKFSTIGRRQQLISFGSNKKGGGPQQLNTPMGIAVHPITGEIYVADCYNHRIQVISDDFLQFHSFGTKGSSLGQFKYPTDVCFSSAGLLYVSDSANRCIKVYSSTEEPMGWFGYRTGVVAGCSGELNNPRYLVIDPYDHIYITETYSSFEMLKSFNDSRVSCYRANGEFLRHIGRRGADKGDFDNPSGIAMDKLGNLYISDTNNDRLVVM